MAAFYDDPVKGTRATDAEVLSVNEGKGAAHGKKCTARIRYNFKGQELTEYVDFWNGSGTKKLDLCDRMHKCSAGDTILILFSVPKTGDDGRTINGSCIDFAREGYPLWVSGMTAMIGSPSVREADTGRGIACALGFKPKDGAALYKYCFWGDLKALGVSKNNPGKVVCMGQDPIQQMTPGGLPVKSFNGFKAYPVITLRNNGKEMSISIGPFHSHPIPLSKLLDVSQKEYPGRLAWCHYVADEWAPKNDPELLRQKDAITKLLASMS